MKKRYYLSSLLILFIGLFFFQSCKQEVSEPDKPVVLSSEKEIISYSVTIAEQSYEGKIDSEKREITIKDVPYDCKIENLKPSFNISDKAKISINDQNQKSGVSSVDFSNPVIYSVTAEDGSKAEWTVKLLKEEKTKYTLILHMNYPESEKSYDIPIHKLENETITLPKLPLAEDNFSLEEDYTFLGWSKKENAEEADYWSYVVYTVRCDTELWGVWKKYTANYTVNVYKQNLNDSYSDEPDETITGKGVIGTHIEYDVSKYEGFTLDKSKNKGALIGADGKSVLNVYLMRKNIPYKVNYYMETLEGSYSDTPDDVKTMSGKFEAKAEYDLSSFPEFFVNEDKTKSVTISADGSTVFNVYLKRGNISYKVNYYKETVEGTYSDTPDEVKTMSGKFGAVAEYDISSYSEFFLDVDKTEIVTISADGSTVVNVYLKRRTFLYKVNYYKETLEGSYSDTPDEVKTLSGKFGAIAEYDVSSYLGFYVDENKTKSVTISADDSTVVNVYLERSLISYRVKLYKETFEGFYSNTPDEVKIRYGKFGETAEYDVSSYHGFSIDTDKIESVTISADSSTVVNVYLKRRTFSYKVNYYKETLEGSYSNTPDEVKTMTGKFGAIAEYDVSSYLGFYVDENKTKPVTIYAVDSTSVNVYLKRKTASYIVNYFKAKTDGTYEDTPDEEKTMSGKVGTVVVFDSNRYAGFEINTDKTKAENITIKEDSSTVLNVYYSRKQINYLVKHFIEDADFNSYNLDISELKTGSYGAEMEYQVKDFGEHISFEKVEYSSSDKTVSEDSYVNVYYKLDTVTFTYKWNIAGKAETVKTFKYGQRVPKLSVEERVLYSFDEWSPSVPETATENKDFEAQWTCLVGTTVSDAPTFVRDLPETIYVKTPVLKSNVYLSVLATNCYNVKYCLYKSEDGINWFETGEGGQGSGPKVMTLELPVTISQDNSDAYYCIAVSKTSNGNCSYSKICKIITNTEDTKNIGSYYYSDGTYSVELNDKKTVVGIVASLKEDKSPKMIIPVDFKNSNSTVNFTTAKQNCESYSQNDISGWKLPDFIELEAILFNTNAINNSLDGIHSSLRIQPPTEDRYLFYWAKSESGNSQNCSLAIYLCESVGSYYSLSEKDMSLKGYYLPVKILE